MIVALLKEISFRKDYLDSQPVETIYFGGGTPSLCTTEEIASLLIAIRANYEVTHDVEVTLEANPDDINEATLLNLKNAGINRLSMGVQSFFEEDLRWMNRAHNATQAREALQSAIRIFPNLTIDLIYGTPQLTEEKWKHNVETAIQAGVPHLSCYALTVEPQTPLDKMIRQHQSSDVDPAKQSAQFLLLMQWMKEQGYEHYEISNFAKPGWRSRHNSAYWKGVHYLGIGPSAHSFNGHSRQWNVVNNQQYIRGMNEAVPVVEKEVLTGVQQRNEYIMISLRTMEGIDLEKITGAREEFLSRCAKYIDSGLMEVADGYVRLTNEGRLLADGIAADLFD